jgi:hypothetical protein
MTRRWKPRIAVVCGTMLSDNAGCGKGAKVDSIP